MSRERVLELLDAVGDFGPLHIVVADGNMDDVHLEFVEEEMRKTGGAKEEYELLTLLKALPVEERDSLWKKHAYG